MLSKTFSDDSVRTPMTTVDGSIPKELIYEVEYVCTGKKSAFKICAQ